MHKLTNNIDLGQIYSGPALALVKVITDDSSAKLKRQIASSHGCYLSHLKKSRRLVVRGGRDRLVVESDRGTWGEGGGQHLCTQDLCTTAFHKKDLGNLHQPFLSLVLNRANTSVRMFSN